jgi:DEAD/DEAH box helicase domain-containing protein
LIRFAQSILKKQIEYEILDIYDRKPVWGTTAYMGKIKVTDQVTEYEIRHISSKKLIKKTELDLHFG